MLPHMSRNSTLRLLSTLLLLVVSVHGAAQENLNPINPLPGVKTWRWSEDRISVRLTQIIPEQVRGFYMGRGFTPEDAALIAGDCIFQTVVRNDSPGTRVRMDMSGWKVVTKAGTGRPKLREDWGKIWKQRNSPAPARLAFRWALFPTVQEFEHGDWNMGMSSYGLPPGARFDLEFVFEVGDSTLAGEILEVECAEDEIPE